MIHILNPELNVDYFLRKTKALKSNPALPTVRHLVLQAEIIIVLFCLCVKMGGTVIGAHVDRYYQ